MSKLEQEFRQAAEVVKTLSGTPSDDEKLELYALFKQCEVGDCNTAKPGMFDLKGKFKWEAWMKKKGLSRDAAMTDYVKLCSELTTKYGL